MIGSTGGGASEPSDTLLPGKAGGAVAVRRTLASTICRMTIPTQATRPRQLRDASTVMRFQPAHQSMINRRFDGPASCPARKSPEQALARKPPIHSPASGKSGHESGHPGRTRISASISTRSALAESDRSTVGVHRLATARVDTAASTRLTTYLSVPPTLRGRGSWHEWPKLLCHPMCRKTWLAFKQ